MTMSTNANTELSWEEKIKRLEAWAGVTDQLLENIRNDQTAFIAPIENDLLMIIGKLQETKELLEYSINAMQ